MYGKNGRERTVGGRMVFEEDGVLNMNGFNTGLDGGGGGLSSGPAGSCGGFLTEWTPCPAARAPLTPQEPPSLP